MGAAFRIAFKDLKLRVRDRSVFILGIIAPLTLAFIFNLIFGGAATGELGLDYGVVDLDSTEISGTFTTVLAGAEQAGILTIEPYLDAAEAEAAIDADAIDAFFVIPDGFEDAVRFNKTTSIRIVGDIDAPTPTQIAAGFAEQFSAGIAASQLAVATTASVEGAPITPGFVAGLTNDPVTASGSFVFQDESAAAKQLDASTYFAAGMAVFFLFFTVQFGVAGLLEEERDGTMARLMAAPIGRSSVVVGKAILSFLVGVISMAVLVVTTSLIMEADWGAPLGVALLTIAGVLAAVGIMGVIAAFAKSPEGAGNFGAIIAVILGMLGGTFFPIGSSGGVLANLTLLTPHAWFLRGLGELSSGAPWTAALPAVAAILVFAAVTWGLAGILIRRRWAL
ncbi:MAG: ABC transporter permease [Acidimicrobiia bacterium]